MEKIMIIGCPGAGKSTFARRLQEATGLPLYYLDMIFHNPDRTTVSREEFDQKLSKILNGDQWIIDGNYQSTIELRLQACDTVFFLDYSLDTCLDGVRSRRGKARTDMPWIEKENEEDVEFIEFIKNYRSESRLVVLELLEKYENKKMHIFKERSEAEEFLNRL